MSSLLNRVLGGLFAVLAIALMPLAFGAGLAAANECLGFEVAQVDGLNDYHLTSCCRKGCGGACCRCGAAAGYLSDCSTSCAIGRADEFKTMKAVPLPNGIIVRGRLVHAEKKTPLANEKVKLVLPGGKIATGTSGADGTFIIRVPGGSQKAKATQVGDLPFVPAAELEKDEPKEYQLFLAPKMATKATS